MVIKFKFKNSLTKSKEEFIPINTFGDIKMYVCGPTLYDFIHIGNARSLVIFDVLFRFLKEIYQDRNIIYVRNITDVDDKIINKAIEMNISEEELVKNMIKNFKVDCNYLNLLEPSFELKVSEEIESCKNIIQSLIDKGFAYENQGNVLFAVDKFKDYGKLSNRNIEENLDNPEGFSKNNNKDFFLWKKTEKGITWTSNWGNGRPGWHIECSAMAIKYLGENFDIHGGGMDLKFPHHENEIAQSVCANTNSFYAKYWIHNGMLMVNAEKMSKSLGNFITVKDLRGKNIKGTTLKLALLYASYDEILNFNYKLLEDLELLVKKIEYFLEDRYIMGLDIDDKKKEYILEILANNFDTSNLIKRLYEFLKTEDLESLVFSLKLLGILEIIKKDKIEIPKEIIDLVEKRNKLKREKKFKEADEIRVQIYNNGFLLRDLENDKYKLEKM